MKRTEIKKVQNGLIKQPVVKSGPWSQRKRDGELKNELRQYSDYWLPKFMEEQ